MTYRRIMLGTAALVGLAASGVAPLAAQDVPTATAALNTAEGEPAGAATFRQLPAGLLVEVELEGVTPGEHGIHIHETGACTPDFEAAGDHFAPEGNGHGFAATENPHPGDLPNIVVGEGGTAAAHFLNARASLTEGDAAVLDDDGAALIVHAGTDSYGETAGAGDRVLCGVIEGAT